MHARSCHFVIRFRKQIVALLLFSVLHMAATAGEALSFDINYPGERLPAPGFTLTSLAGKRSSLDDYHGKVVLAHFWATFCIPCVREMPELESLWQEYREQGLVVLGIAADRGSESVVREFAGKTGVTFPILLDPDGTVRNRYEVVALPMTYLIGRDGKISARMIGAREWTIPEGRAILERLLETLQTE